MSGRMTVLEAVRSSVTDLGRSGFAHLGLQTNGAADQLSARTANALVGNTDRSAIIETTAATLAVQTANRLLVAVTGAAKALTINGISVPLDTPVLTWPQAEIRIEPGEAGVHHYLALHGQIDGDNFFGSCAPDPLIGRGRTLHAGEEIIVRGSEVGTPPHLPLFRVSAQRPRFGHDWTLDLLPGPEIAEFPDFLQCIEEANYAVDHRSNQIGTRLAGPRFDRRATSEILSRGVPVGAVEMPPDGNLIALQRGRPMTAGYPIPGVIARSSHGELAQLRPGDTVRFRLTTIADSISRLQEQERALAALRARCHTAFDACSLFRLTATPSDDRSLAAVPIPLHHVSN